NPTVMFEALGCAIPFIGTNVGGIPEIIVSEEYGLVVEPSNPEVLARAVLGGLERTWDREAIARYSRQFSWDAIGQEILKEYARVLSDP
ncbi:MAG TPA: glycosyltransferase, partial [Methanoregulaceae archaeon]|nr:glycosyltransferase [Methanoregulaceae archaeon]